MPRRRQRHSVNPPSRSEAPESGFRPLPPAQPADIRFVHLNTPRNPEIAGAKTPARPQVTSGMTVAAGSGLGEGEIDHRPEQKCRRERIFTREGFRRWCQDLVMIAVQILRSLVTTRAALSNAGHDTRNQTALSKLTVSFRMTQGPLLRLEIIKVRKPLQVVPQMPR